MTYELLDPSLAGLAGFRGFGAFGSAAGDQLGTSCLCSVTSACTSAAAQNAAMPKLRAAMAEAGIPTSTGVWKQSETNALNAWSSGRGGGTSSKFLPDGAPCTALKQFLSAPAPIAVTPSTVPITDCASLLAAAPPVPPGTPVETVVAVLSQLAPGFNVRQCLGLPPTTPTPPPADVLPPTGSTVTTTVSGSSSKLLPMLAIGGVALLAIGGVAMVALSPKMRKNGRRRTRRGGR